MAGAIRKIGLRLAAILCRLGGTPAGPGWVRGRRSAMDLSGK
jgi:hypothetical protein